MSYTAPKTTPNPTPRPSFWRHPVSWMKWKPEVCIVGRCTFSSREWNMIIKESDKSPKTSDSA